MDKMFLGSWILKAVLLYFIVAAFLYFYQRNLQYFPAGPKPVLEGHGGALVLTQIETEPGLVIEGLYLPPKDPDFPVIVFFHGNGQAYQYWLNKLLTFYEQGYGAYLADYRGYGGNPGKPTEQGLYQDARKHIGWLIDKEGFKAADFIFYGESLGSGVAVQMAKEFTPAALVLESPFSSVVDVAAATYWMFPTYFMMRDRYDSLSKIADLKIPKLFIHAAQDKIVPIRFAQKLYQAAPEPKEFIAIEQGGHNDLFDNGAALHVSEFLSKITSQRVPENADNNPSEQEE